MTFISTTPSMVLFFLILLVASSIYAQDDEMDVTATPTPSSTISSLNDCDNLTIGEFTFLLVSSSDPFDEISFFGFQDLPGNLNLYLTDNAWTGDSFATAEGVMMLTTPPEGIPAGITVGLGPAETVYQYGRSWQSVQGVFALSTEGEQVFLYCLDGSNQPRPIAAISYNGPFLPPNLPDYGFNTSAVPQELVDANATIVLPHEHRWQYIGPKLLEINELKAAIQDTETNWEGTSVRNNSGSTTVMSRTTMIVTSFLISVAVAVATNSLW
ncbi:hypothetical protein IV203_032139 [Nitzschia inconspicua]|uniref:DOMON domain-containing protein n=1 Tax=Nitzschia inconspicua TaxID=303405 RepID=A0A9K3LYF0_9STRA|nr:hypothetical protein IV203_032139 [Nitzschia inconspicua]